MRRTNKSNTQDELDQMRGYKLEVDGKFLGYDELVVVRNPTEQGLFKFKWVDPRGNVTVYGPVDKRGTPKQSGAAHRTFREDRIERPKKSQLR